MIDAEVYLHQLLVRDVQEQLEEDETLAIAPDIDVNQLAHLPAVLFTVTGDGQVANGPGLWSFTLTLSVFGEGMDQAKRFARLLYDVVHHWDDRPDLTPISIDGENTWVSELDDIDLFSRLSSADIDGRNVTQYVGSFALALRN